MSKKIILLVGKSGAGKSAIASVLREAYDLKEVQSYTTRPKRNPNEKGHIFVEPSEFELLKDKLCAYTKFNGYEYGVTSDQIDENDVYVVDPAGVEYFMNSYKGNKEPYVVAITAPLMVRIQRMNWRGDKTIDVIKRVFNDAKMFRRFRRIAQLVVKNDDLFLCADEIKNEADI